MCFQQHATLKRAFPVERLFRDEFVFSLRFKIDISKMEGNTMLLFYTKGYHGTFVRFLQSFFINMPLTLWFRWVSLVVYFWQNDTFVNYSSLTDQQLLSIWAAAAQQLATQQINLSATGSILKSPDPRALTVQPKNVAVISVPDWSVADLVEIDASWAKHAVPTGTFAADTGTDYETVHGITMPWKRPRIYGATSVLAAVLIWEFQNVILNKLGYDTSNR
jgi:hypothetical protein